MDCRELTHGIYHLLSGSNVGLVTQDGKGLLIDTGLDKDSCRRALRIAEEMDIQVVAAFLTHAHADHFGGASYLQRRGNVKLYAPALEAAIMEHPIIEPLYLFGGAMPISDLRHKFTLAPACHIDQVVEAGPMTIQGFAVEAVSLPGHAPNQMGLAVENILFSADTFFPQETLTKHKVPFCVDLDKAIRSLESVPTMESYQLFAPGHGPVYKAGDEIRTVCQTNQERLEAIRDLVAEITQQPETTEEVVANVADVYGLRLKTPVAYLLTRSTVLAALSSLERSGKVEVALHEKRMTWKTVG